MICSRNTVVVSVLLLCAIVGTTAFAKNLSDFTWTQATGSKTITLGELYPGSNINSSGVKFYAVATAATNGTFDVVLQRQGFLGVWTTVGRATGSQSYENKTDPRNGGIVQGQPFMCTWPTTDSGNYRIILENTTSPQRVRFTRVEAWAY